eukprot:IDg15680t1
MIALCQTNEMVLHRTEEPLEIRTGIRPMTGLGITSPAYSAVAGLNLVGRSSMVESVERRD